MSNCHQQDAKKPDATNQTVGDPDRVHAKERQKSYLSRAKRMLEDPEKVLAYERSSTKFSREKRLAFNPDKVREYERNKTKQYRERMLAKDACQMFDTMDMKESDAESEKGIRYKLPTYVSCPFTQVAHNS